MFYLAGIALAIFLGALLITKKGRTQADLLLSLWLLFIGAHLFFFYTFIISKNYSLPHLLGLELPLPLIHGSFLYVYTATVTRQNAIRPIHLLHFLPFLLSYLLFTDFYLLRSDQKIFVYEHKGAGYKHITAILFIAIIISGVAYVIGSLQLLRKHKLAICQNFSSIDKINLAWLKYMIYSIGVIWIFVIAKMPIFTFGAAVVFIFFLGYFGISQVGIFTQRNVTANSNSEETNEIGNVVSATQEDIVETKTHVLNSSKKYIRSGLSPEMATEIHRALQDVMYKKRLYTDPELSLSELADHLGVHANSLSQVINTHENKNFYDYVNSFRIEEFKRIVTIPENQKFTLLAIAHDCGFNSKTSFNRNFKIVTGLSPSEYLKRQHAFEA